MHSCLYFVDYIERDFIILPHPSELQFHTVQLL